MNIAYFDPLSRAWNRMKIALFKPFDLHKWFVVGFNAFLAGLMESPGGSGSSGSRGRAHMDFDDFLNFPSKAWGWLMDHPGWFIAILFIITFIITLVIVLTWLSSRGSFMFLDNVVQDKAEIVKPWKQYRREGNSLFLWRLGFGLVCFIVIISIFILFMVGAEALYGNNQHARIPVVFIIEMGLLFFIVIIVIRYISMFLKNFVVPLMYKYNITTTQAWGRYLMLFRQHPFHFLLFGLLVLVMTILVVIGLIFAGLLTCCIGFILLVIPYIGTVVTLPVWYTFRAFGLEYLAQFGPDYNVFPPAKKAAEQAAA